MYSLGLDIMLIPMINIKPYRAPTMAKPRQESIKSPDGPRLLRVVELYVIRRGGRPRAGNEILNSVLITPKHDASATRRRGRAPFGAAGSLAALF